MTTPHVYPGSEIDPKIFIKKMTHNAGSVHKYEISKPSSVAWPHNTNLINFCDDGSCNFGGSVNHISATFAKVSVYVD